MVARCDPAVVDHAAPLGCVCRAALLRRATAVLRVDLGLIEGRLADEVLREVRLARVEAVAVGVVHADWVRLTRAVVVRHLLDQELDQGLVLRTLLDACVRTRRVRQLGANHRVDRLRGERPVLLVKNDQDVRVWQPALLELDHVQVRNHLAKDAVLVQFLQQHVELELEDARQQVGAVGR